MEYTVSDLLKNCLALEEKAATEYTRAKLIWAKDVIYDYRSRMKCSLNTCGHYGNNFMCPPKLEDVSFYRRMNESYRLAILVQDQEDWHSPHYDEAMEKKFKEMSVTSLKKLVKLENSAFGCGLPYALASAGGNCKLCDPCKARLGEPACAHPDLARPSMEAMGIDIAATCSRAGLPADFLPGRLLVTGLLYLY